RASFWAQGAIARSGTVSHIRSASSAAPVARLARAPTRLAKDCAVEDDLPESRKTISSISYPARNNAKASDLPKFPGPTMLIRGFPGMAGRIAGVEDGHQPVATVTSNGTFERRLRL